MDRTIIAAARGEDAHDAIALATVLARIYDARVLIAGIYVEPAGGASYAEEHADRERVRTDLAALSADMPGDVTYDIVLCEGSTPADGIEQLAEREAALAVVLGPTHVDGAGRLLHRDVATGLVHDAPCAIAVAPRGIAQTLRYPPAVIGVAWDDRPGADDVLRAAGELARRTRAELRLLHVAARPTGHDDAMAMALTRRAEALGVTPAPRPVILSGDPIAALAQAAQDVDLLVTGSRAHGPLRRALLGSVSLGLLHQVSCPMLVLPRGAGIAAAV